MTLNTFHLAGHGGVNVTLGIPRLREIIMTAGQKIKTPSMIIPPLPNVTKEDLEKIANKLKRVRLDEIVKDVEVVHKIDGGGDKGMLLHTYEVSIHLEDVAAVTTTFDVPLKTIYKIFKEQFVPALLTTITKEMKKSKESVKNKTPEILMVNAEHKAKAVTQNEDEEGELKEGAY